MLFFKIFSRKDAKAQSFFLISLRLCASACHFFLAKTRRRKVFFLISLRLCGSVCHFFSQRRKDAKLFFLFLCATAALRAIFFREGAAEFYKTDTNAVYPSGTWPYTILYKQAYFQECLQTPHSLLRYLLRGQDLSASRHI